MLTLAAFVLALGLLIAVHEFGHYRMAVFCGVKVLRFSIGFGKPVYTWRPKGSATEFVIAAFPLGGYVKMLDQREATVCAEEKHLAFDQQALRSRVAIVAAGPAANLLLAVVLYTLVNWIGVPYPAPILASPGADSVAARAGLTGGEKVLQAGFDGTESLEVQSMEDLRWFLTRGVLEKRDVHLLVRRPATRHTTDVMLRLSAVDGHEFDSELFHRIGIVGPYTQPVIGPITTGAAADKAGLREGDIVHQVGGLNVVDGQHLRQLIRASAAAGQATQMVWQIRRNGVPMEVVVTPQAQREGDRWVGKIGAYVGAAPEMVVLRYGALDGLWRGFQRCWDMSALTLKMMGRMLIGEASLKNLSGPLSIADYAGKSANLGVTQYLLFLALISVSLGVLNLLPLPVLDGGHLMYYLWEWITGKPVAQASMERLQRGGVAVLFVMMSIAIFNDISRLFG